MSVVQPLLNASDFAVCEAERIDAPGAIQGQGGLFALSRDSLRLTHSALAGAWGAAQGERLQLGMDATALAQICGIEVDLRALCGAILTSENVRAQPVEIASDAEATWFLSLGATHFILERRPEPALSPPAESWLERLPAAVNSPISNIFALSQAAADQVRGQLGFDRVMVYRFAPDSTGEVIAESRATDMPPYLGLRYPATDIPSQARRLYLEHRIREIVDTNATAIALEPPGSATAASPVDLSTSILRAISPYHLEYMSNMGVRATLVASIVIDGALWGLLACHHRAPKLVAASQRRAVLVASAALADRIDAISRHAAARRSAQIASALASVARAAAGSGNFATMLLETTIDMMSADGAASISSWWGVLHQPGRCPRSVRRWPKSWWMASSPATGWVIWQMEEVSISTGRAAPPALSFREPRPSCLWRSARNMSGRSVGAAIRPARRKSIPTPESCRPGKVSRRGGRRLPGVRARGRIWRSAFSPLCRTAWPVHLSGKRHRCMRFSG
jgi:light-regulated signal transduction histidine kinase (bacteriophytochrome)